MKRTLLIGPAASGKSRASKLMLLGNYHYVTLDLTQLRGQRPSNVHGSISSMLRHADFKVTTIICEEVPLKQLEKVMSFFFNEEIIVNPQGKPAFAIYPIELILIAQDTVTYNDVPKSPSYLRRYNIIECLSSNNHCIVQMMHHPIEIDPVYQPTQQQPLP
jgi:hypothetical protein